MEHFLIKSVILHYIHHYGTHFDKKCHTSLLTHLYFLCLDQVYFFFKMTHLNNRMHECRSICAHGQERPSPERERPGHVHRKPETMHLCKVNVGCADKCD